jgi:hypothetical protein
VLGLKRGDVRGCEPDRHFDRQRRAVVGEHEPLQGLVPEPVVPYRRNDQRRYGVEVKNQLGYIDQTEFQIKLAMCVHFGIRPMFVTRAMPKNYIYAVMRSGGFSLLTDR